MDYPSPYNHRQRHLLFSVHVMNHMNLQKFPVLLPLYHSAYRNTMESLIDIQLPVYHLQKEDFENWNI